MALVLRGLLSGFPVKASRIDGPGTRIVTLTEPGTYTISYERRISGVGGSFASGGESLADVPSVSLQLGSEPSGAAVELRTPSTIFTYQVGNTEGQAVAQFHIDHPGTYVLTSEYSSGASEPRFTLAIARGSPADVGIAVLGALAAAALLGAGITMGILTLALRPARRRSRLG